MFQLTDKIKEVLKRFKPEEKKQDTFCGIVHRYDVTNCGQQWLEKAVHDMPKGDRFDYCFIWCLCCALKEKYLLSFGVLALALARVSPNYFSKVDGYVKSIAKTTDQIAEMCNFPSYIDRVAKIDGEHNSKTIQEAKRVITSLGVPDKDLFLMARYEPEHYTYVNLGGYEFNPFPGYQGRFVGFRVYKFIKRGKV